MCILFIVPGDAHHDLIIASNRDEYFHRETIAGSICEGSSVFSPLDVEAGGTWLAFDPGRRRFSVVLNCHEWRFNRAVPSGTVFKSRGLLPKGFVNGSMSAFDFSSGLVSQLREYRGFNLVVGDEEGTYFISNVSGGSEGSGVVRLEAGVIYGVANGCLDDPTWHKLTRGKQLFQSLLESASLDEECLQSPALRRRRLASDVLHQVMLDSQPHDDPTFGAASSSLAKRIAAIFVRPCVLRESRPGEEREDDFRIPAAAGAAAGVDLDGELGRDVMRRHETFQRELLDVCETSCREVFGTRTSTVIVSDLHRRSTASVPVVWSVSADNGGMSQIYSATECAVVLERDFNISQNQFVYQTFICSADV